MTKNDCLKDFIQPTSQNPRSVVEPVYNSIQTGVSSEKLQIFVFMLFPDGYKWDNNPSRVHNQIKSVGEWQRNQVHPGFWAKIFEVEENEDDESVGDEADDDQRDLGVFHPRLGLL